MDNIDRINAIVENLHEIKRAINSLPLAQNTIDTHCELRSIYLERLNGLKNLFVMCIGEFNIQESRIQRHIQQLKADKLPSDK